MNINKNPDNFFEQQKFESLQAIIYWLDGLKTLWFQAELAKNLNHNLFAAARKLQAELDAIPLFCTLPDWMKMPEVIQESFEAYATLPDDHPLAGEIKSFMAKSSDDNPWWISFGAFWNEIRNPLFIDSLIDKLGEYYSNQPELHCMGSERAVQGKYKEGTAAIGFYDIGSELLVFASEEAADAFEEANPVDPSERYVFANNGWVSC